MDTESIMAELVLLHHQKLQNVHRSDDLLRRAAAQLNACAAATGSAVLIDLSHGRPNAGEVTASHQEGSRQTRPGSPTSEGVPFTRLMCEDLSFEEIVGAGIDVVVQALPHFPFWLDSSERFSVALGNLKRIVDVYHHDLLRQRGLRRTWRTIAAALDNNREKNDWSAERRGIVSALETFIQQYILMSAATSAFPA